VLTATDTRIIPITCRRTLAPPLPVSRNPGSARR
jgi:hypothetical protein